MESNILNLNQSESIEYLNQSHQNVNNNQKRKYIILVVIGASILLIVVAIILGIVLAIKFKNGDNDDNDNETSDIGTSDIGTSDINISPPVGGVLNEIVEPEQEPEEGSTFYNIVDEWLINAPIENYLKNRSNNKCVELEKDTSGEFRMVNCPTTNKDNLLFTSSFGNLKVKSNGKCMSVIRDTVIPTNCDTYNNDQKWIYNNKKIRHKFSDKCLDIKDDKVVATQCIDSNTQTNTTQNWDTLPKIQTAPAPAPPPPPKGIHLKYSGTNKCLSVQDGTNVVSFQDCNTSDDKQRFLLITEPTRYQHLKSKMCLMKEPGEGSWAPGGWIYPKVLLTNCNTQESLVRFTDDNNLECKPVGSKNCPLQNRSSEWCIQPQDSMSKPPIFEIECRSHIFEKVNLN